MKKNIFILALSTYALFSCNEKISKEGNIIVEGEIKSLKQGTLYFQRYEDFKLHTLDSVVIKGNSTFKTAIQLDEPEMIFLTLNRGTSLSEDNHIMFFAEPGTIEIKSSLDRFYYDAKISGSKNQEIYDKYTATKKNFVEKKNDLIKDQLLASKNRNIHKADSLLKQINHYDSRIHLNAVNFALKNPNAIASAYITLTDVIPFSDRYLDTIYNSLTPDVKNHKYGLLIKDYKNSLKQEVMR